MGHKRKRRETQPPSAIRTWAFGSAIPLLVLVAGIGIGIARDDWTIALFAAAIILCCLIPLCFRTPLARANAVTAEFLVLLAVLAVLGAPPVLYLQALIPVGLPLIVVRLIARANTKTEQQHYFMELVDEFLVFPAMAIEAASPEPADGRIDYGFVTNNLWQLFRLLGVAAALMLWGVLCFLPADETMLNDYLRFAGAALATVFVGMAIAFGHRRPRIDGLRLNVWMAALALAFAGYGVELVGNGLFDATARDEGIYRIISYRNIPNLFGNRRFAVVAEPVDEAAKLRRLSVPMLELRALHGATVSVRAGDGFFGYRWRNARLWGVL